MTTMTPCPICHRPEWPQLIRDGRCPECAASVRPPKDQRVLALLEAQAILTDVLDSLKTERKVCECCSLPKFTNWVEGQMSIELTAVIKKLEKHAARLTEQAEGLEERGEGEEVSESAA
jgi:hypothetical protein